VDDGRGGVDEDEVTIEVDTPPSVVLLEPAPETKLDDGDIVLSWSGEDGDGDALVYDIYVDTANPPARVEASGYTGSSLTLTELEPGTTYYWKVVVDDGFASHESEVGSFEVKEEDDESSVIEDVTEPVVIIPATAIIGAVALVVVFQMRRREEEYYDEEEYGDVFCPACGSATQYSEEADDHYCWECEEYLGYG